MSRRRAGDPVIDWARSGAATAPARADGVPMPCQRGFKCISAADILCNRACVYTFLDSKWFLTWHRLSHGDAGGRTPDGGIERRSSGYSSLNEI